VVLDQSLDHDLAAHVLHPTFGNQRGPFLHQLFRLAPRRIAAYHADLKRHWHERHPFAFDGDSKDQIELTGEQRQAD
jgi:hypothetical protein